MHLDDLDDRHDRGLQYDLATLWRRRRVLQLFSGVALAAMTGRSDDNDGDRATSTATPSSPQRRRPQARAPRGPPPPPRRSSPSPATLAAGYAASLVVGI